jgi:hypothetical protein
MLDVVWAGHMDSLCVVRGQIFGEAYSKGASNLKILIAASETKNTEW